MFPGLLCCGCVCCSVVLCCSVAVVPVSGCTASAFAASQTENENKASGLWFKIKPVLCHLAVIPMKTTTAVRANPPPFSGCYTDTRDTHLYFVLGGEGPDSAASNLFSTSPPTCAATFQLLSTGRGGAIKPRFNDLDNSREVAVWPLPHLTSCWLGCVKSKRFKTPIITQSNSKIMWMSQEYLISKRLCTVTSSVEAALVQIVLKKCHSLVLFFSTNKIHLLPLCCTSENQVALDCLPASTHFRPKARRHTV